MANGLKKSHALSTGLLELTSEPDSGDGLFCIAERQNPKRAFLFVSTILGRHIPVAPKRHHAIISRLVGDVASRMGTGSFLVMGMAETAVGLGAEVFDGLRRRFPNRTMCYLPTTRHPIPGMEIWFRIKEEHSHAMDHFVLCPVPDLIRSGLNRTLVLVDDEMTTGKTLAGLSAGLSDAGQCFERIILVTLMDWSGGCAAKQVSNVTGTPVETVSLISGEWVWHPKPNAVPLSSPVAISPKCPEWYPPRTGSNPFFSPPRSETSMFRAPRSGLDRWGISNGAVLARELKQSGLPDPKKK